MGNENSRGSQQPPEDALRSGDDGSHGGKERTVPALNVGVHRRLSCDSVMVDNERQQQQQSSGSSSARARPSSSFRHSRPGIADSPMQMRAEYTPLRRSSTWAGEVEKPENDALVKTLPRAQQQYNMARERRELRLSRSVELDELPDAPFDREKAEQLFRDAAFDRDSDASCPTSVDCSESTAQSSCVPGSITSIDSVWPDTGSGRRRSPHLKQPTLSETPSLASDAEFDMNERVHSIGSAHSSPADPSTLFLRSSSPEGAGSVKRVNSDTLPPSQRPSPPAERRTSIHQDRNVSENPPANWNQTTRKDKSSGIFKLYRRKMQKKDGAPAGRSLDCATTMQVEPLEPTPRRRPSYIYYSPNDDLQLTKPEPPAAASPSQSKKASKDTAASPSKKVNREESFKYGTSFRSRSRPRRLASPETPEPAALPCEQSSIAQALAESSKAGLDPAGESGLGRLLPRFKNAFTSPSPQNCHDDAGVVDEQQGECKEAKQLSAAASRPRTSTIGARPSMEVRPSKPLGPSQPRSVPPLEVSSNDSSQNRSRLTSAATSAKKKTNLAPSAENEEDPLSPKARKRSSTWSNPSGVIKRPNIDKERLKAEREAKAHRQKLLDDLEAMRPKPAEPPVWVPRPPSTFQQERELPRRPEPAYLRLTDIQPRMPCADDADSESANAETLYESAEALRAHLCAENQERGCEERPSVDESGYLRLLDLCADMAKLEAKGKKPQAVGSTDGDDGSLTSGSFGDILPSHHRESMQSDSYAGGLGAWRGDSLDAVLDG
ncbi:uncharacterized protein LOC135805467 [Sycon ciliatum]|uniref:uncharacterized protein LOC135805467 n=1 Tax=Sycon ciliatum TaxID=27933 RepID=UPI0020AB2ACD|eukprot:scpid45241/ scgid20186/ 